MWDPRPGTAGGTRDPRTGTHPMGETRDLRHENLKVEPETRDPGRLLYMGPRPRTLKERPRTLKGGETRNAK